MRILVVDDSAELQALLGRALRDEGHTVRQARMLAEADDALREAPAFDLLVLDLGLPDGWGLDWCRRLRAEGFAGLVLLLTAHSEVRERIAGFEAGADDFLAKPFAVAELRGRVRALARRREGPRRTVLVHETSRVDLAARRASRDGVECPITAREWSVLDCLASAGGRVVPRAQLLDEVWGDTSDAAARSLDVIVARIRKKLGAVWIRTSRGDGYALGL